MRSAPFSPERLPALQAAVSDLSWLQGRGYSGVAALKLVGDRHGLDALQRKGVARCACAPGLAAARIAARVDTIRGRAVHVDGFNCLITVEEALAGRPVLRGRDSAWRDVAGAHGRRRDPERTREALARLGQALVGAAQVRWLFDAPVSHSGRLRAQVEALAAARGWDWIAAVVPDPDPVLAATEGAVIATSDSWILDRSDAWVDLPGRVIDALPDVERVELDT